MDEVELPLIYRTMDEVELPLITTMDEVELSSLIIGTEVFYLNRQLTRI